MRRHFWLVNLPFMLAVSCGGSISSPLSEVAVHRDSMFYQNLKEPEQLLEGTVRIRQTAEPPPNKIGGRWFNLVVDGVAYPMPAPREQLAAFVNKSVVVRGKIHATVWPDDQQSHDEVWVGTIKVK